MAVEFSGPCTLNMFQHVETQMSASLILAPGRNLSALESQAALHGMKLNYERTEILYHSKFTPPDVRFHSGERVKTATQNKYLGKKISWAKPFEVAYQHRAGIAETAYKKLRLIWNSLLSKKKKLHIFQPTFLPTLTYGLDALTLTDKYLARVDAYYSRFLRRIVNIKASYYSGVTNHSVWRIAGYPKKPSFFFKKSQSKLLEDVFFAQPEEPIHHVFFVQPTRIESRPQEEDVA